MTTKKAEQLLKNALKLGNITAIGGIVYDLKMKALMNTTDLFKASLTIPIERIDAGGSPEWRKIL